MLNAHPCTAMSFVNAKRVGRKIPDLGRSHRGKKRETTELQRTAFLREIPHQPSRTIVEDIELELVAD